MPHDKQHKPSRIGEYKAPKNFNKENKGNRPISDYFGKQAKGNVKKAFDSNFKKQA